MMTRLPGNDVRPVSSLAFDFRALLLFASFGAPSRCGFHGDTLDRAHISIACKASWVANIMSVFMCDVPLPLFPFPLVALQVPAEGQGMILLHRHTAFPLHGRACDGGPRWLLARTGVCYEGNDIYLQHHDTCTPNECSREALASLAAPMMAQGHTELSPTCMVEDIAGCDVALGVARYFKLDALRQVPCYLAQAVIVPRLATPVLVQETGRVAVYVYEPNPGRGESARLLLYDGSGDAPESVSTGNDAVAHLAERGLIAVPRFCRPGVLVVVPADITDTSEQQDGTLADCVSLADEALWLHAPREPGSPALHIGIIVPHTTRAHDPHTWINRRLMYKVDVTPFGSGDARHEYVGVSDMRRCVVPYGSDVLVAFVHLLAAPEANKRQAITEAAAVGARRWALAPDRAAGCRATHVWCSLSFLDEEDATTAHAVCVLVCEFATDFVSFEKDHLGQVVPVGKRTRRRFIVHAQGLALPADTPGAACRSEYFAYTGTANHWLGRYE